ncbi:hypothetical protein IVB45_23110 [Bradyrhizobium sp. 4]|uniref:hypothetical protein n=1 Tax=unclassified Bradyrhizobium TaxID=2631580 RepID=UPI001FFA5966|nr:MULTISPECIES: hypothetical protein [unclassified Bradyrhizobium]MCK1402789.1 hypothetical protein [Bradyrhizobium sp. 39]MCK1748384.1 hypothetical protein [Bradyrhizobium sp. 135]UPJ32855.1 hypothetical protein IVB45_23110 [Bradyrhizobium sp. 4]
MSTGVLSDESNGFVKSADEPPIKPLIYLPPATVHGVVFEVLFAAAKRGTLLAGFSMAVPARRQHLELSRKA